MTNPDLDLRDPEWLAEQLGIEKNTLYKFLNEGVIPALKIGKKWLVDPADIKEFFAAERRRQTIERRAQGWLSSELDRLLGESKLPIDVVVTPALVADAVRAIEYQCDQHGYMNATFIPDVPSLMALDNLRLVPCNECAAVPVLYAREDVHEPLCDLCIEAEQKRYKNLPKEERAALLAKYTVGAGAAAAESKAGKEEA